jgi:hypothetical protein
MSITFTESLKLELLIITFGDHPKSVILGLSLKF